jgi:hypothetical protein
MKGLKLGDFVILVPALTTLSKTARLFANNL